MAVSLVINYEEGAEKTVADGDAGPERVGELSPMHENIRDLAQESIFEYGSRVGLWRILHVLDKHQVNATFFACAQAMERNPIAAREITRRGHEICSHGYRWDEHYFMSKKAERNSIRKAVRSLEKTTGKRPVGWYCRRGPSIYTRDLLVDEGFLYDSDAYNDDVPYLVKVKGKNHLVVPYTPDANDFQFWLNRFATQGEFCQYLTDTFDVLYEESKSNPKMMSVGLHGRVVGRPGRIRALDSFIRYAEEHSGVWFARRVDIAHWWLKHYG